jgi:hypothetical protein
MNILTKRGFYYRGFAQQSANATDHVTVTYSCQYTHNLNLGTSLSSASGEMTATHARSIRAP